MTARAYVSYDFPFDAVAVYLVEDRGGYRALAAPVELVMNAVEPEAAPAAASPTLRLPEDVARALLDALAAHFGGTSEVQTLRKDYVAERARVDKMIDHLTGGVR